MMCVVTFWSSDLQASSDFLATRAVKREVRTALCRVTLVNLTKEIAELDFMVQLRKPIRKKILTCTRKKTLENIFIAEFWLNRMFSLTDKIWRDQIDTFTINIFPIKNNISEICIIAGKKITKKVQSGSMHCKQTGICQTVLHQES